MCPRRSMISSALSGNERASPTATILFPFIRIEALPISRRSASMQTTHSAFFSNRVRSMLLPVGSGCVLPDNSGKLLAELIAGNAANSGNFNSDRRKRS